MGKMNSGKRTKRGRVERGKRRKKKQMQKMWIKGKNIKIEGSEDWDKIKGG